MKLRTAISTAVVVLLTGTAAAQVHFQHRHKLRPTTHVRPMPGFGEALAGLDAVNKANFDDGKEEFENIETAEGGLGPAFNGPSCGTCHTAGAIGGASDKTVTRFGRLTNGVFDPLERLGGSLLQALAIDPGAQERVPAEANVVTKRVTTPLFGAGLIEAIPDAEIWANTFRQKPDGIKGRVSKVTDVVSGKSRLGRFGWKAQNATLLTFAGDAYLNEMGITSRFFPKENAPNGDAAILAKFDLVPDEEDEIDPATGKSDIDHQADFMRFLAPPPRLVLTDSAQKGERTFQRINCSVCHTPVMLTGENKISALSRKPVRLFSDLLLHDMGSLGDGIEQAAAKGTEMRTAPLWGLRVRTPLLHDGRAKTVTEAIVAHEGEGAGSRNRFNALSATEKKELLDYLNSI